MNTVVEKQKTTEVVVIEPTLEERMLDWMIKEVRGGRWIKGAMRDGHGGHCTLGMVQEVSKHVR